MKEVNPGYPRVDTLWFPVDDSLRVFEVTTDTHIKVYDLYDAATQIILGQLKPRYDLPAKPYNPPKYKYKYPGLIFMMILGAGGASLLWSVLTSRVRGDQRMRDCEKKQEERLSSYRLKAIGAHCLNLNSSPPFGEQITAFCEQLRVLMRVHGLESDIELIQVGALESTGSEPTIFVGVHGSYPVGNQGIDQGLEMMHQPLVVKVPCWVCRVEFKTSSVIFLSTGHYLMSMANGAIVQSNGLPEETRFFVRWEIRPDCEVTLYTAPDIIAIPAAKPVSATEVPPHVITQDRSGDDIQPDTTVESSRVLTFTFVERKNGEVTHDVVGSIELPKGVEAHQITFDNTGIVMKTLRPSQATT